MSHAAHDESRRRAADVAQLDRAIARQLESAGNLVSGLDRPDAHAVASKLWAWANEYRLSALHLTRGHPEAVFGCLRCTAAVVELAELLASEDEGFAHD